MPSVRPSLTPSAAPTVSPTAPTIMQLFVPTASPTPSPTVTEIPTTTSPTVSLEYNDAEAKSELDPRIYIGGFAFGLLFLLLCVWLAQCFIPACRDGSPYNSYNFKSDSNPRHPPSDNNMVPQEPFQPNPIVPVQVELQLIDDQRLPVSVIKSSRLSRVNS